MKIVINSKRRIFAIQKEFSSMFPTLEILFYAKPSNSGGAHSEKLITHGSRSLKDCRAIHEEGVLEILPTMTISELKSRFSDTYGLKAEVFPKPVDGILGNPVVDDRAMGEI
ncbi:MAG: hypothetical protein A2X18_01275 [Bacteroidetes bacterium GWF2_40_14]|nr:MAG: hypothetical protein A2X18_01275 [Bacteroidetes bacterium GWF2_40_14]